MRSVLALALAAGVASCEAKKPVPAVAGEPCPVLTAAAFAERSGRVKTSEFPTFTLQRRSGHMACETFSGVPVCQLSAPGVLHVSAGKENWYFEPGVGKRVTLLVEKAGPRCVVGADRAAEDWAKENMTQKFGD